MGLLRLQYVRLRLVQLPRHDGVSWIVCQVSVVHDLWHQFHIGGIAAYNWMVSRLRPDTMPFLLKPVLYTLNLYQAFQSLLLSSHWRQIDGSVSYLLTLPLFLLHASHSCSCFHFSGTLRQFRRVSTLLPVLFDFNLFSDRIPWVVPRSCHLLSLFVIFIKCTWWSFIHVLAVHVFLFYQLKSNVNYKKYILM